MSSKDSTTELIASAKVTAILVVHDGQSWLPEVVASIASQSRKANNLIAIDTGSNDSSVKLLKGARIPVTTIDREIGFGAAISHAISLMPARSDLTNEWIWILHDDCSLAPGALAALLGGVVDRPTVAMAGPKLLGWHDRTHLLEAGISIATDGSRWTGLEHNEYDQGQRDGIHEVLSVSTAGALIRRDVFEELGGFDQNLELFRDDVDFGWRLRTAGHNVVVVTDAIGFHAQASASERRSVDVAGAFLHRPLLLDRRNAAYVLLANASLFWLPLLTAQLLASSLIRAAGYLLAKLPGYAGDEILAVATLLIHPAELIQARRMRRKTRLLPVKVIKEFIPSRAQQLRSGIATLIDNLREKIFRVAPIELPRLDSQAELNEDEDLLTPIKSKSWVSLFRRPIFLATSILLLISLGWSRNRLGAISGGALPPAPAHLIDLWKLYLANWHEIGMGSSAPTPPYILAITVASIFTIGNVTLLVTIFFLFSPFLLLASSHSQFKRWTENRWLSGMAALLYSISPVAISAVNAGRIGLLVFLIILPLTLKIFETCIKIETPRWRKFCAYILLVSLLFSFNPTVFLILLLANIYFGITDYLFVNKDYRDKLFLERLRRRVIFVLAPLLLCAPWSFEAISRPSKFLLEIGLHLPGGGSNLALIANPGGPGSLPWWCVSPVIVVLLITFFSTTQARRYSIAGFVFLLSATFISAFAISGNGDSLSGRVFAGTLIATATLLSLVAGVVMLDDVRHRLEQAHINYRHFAVATLIILSSAYLLIASLWLVTAGANSPVRANAQKVLPAFLATESGSKILVLRSREVQGRSALAYYISRGSEATLGEPDLAPKDSQELISATEGLVDNTGVGSSKVFATYGVKYIFLKSPLNDDLVRTIDGLGGFNRTSATDAGIVWQVNEKTGHLRFTSSAGYSSILESNGSRSYVPGPGTITITENFSSGWQILQSGVRLERIRDANSLPTFTVAMAGDILVIHDGTVRRGWISIFLIAFVTFAVLALPAGRRKREISDRELS